MPATGPIQTYESFVEYQESGVIDLAADSFKWALFLSTTNAGDLTRTIYGNLTNEHANANGYLTGGVALTGLSLARAGRILTFDADDPSWTAAGGNIVFRRVVLYKVGTVSGVVNPLVCTFLIDPTPADATILDGNTGVIQLPAGGILTIGGGA